MIASSVACAEVNRSSSLGAEEVLHELGHAVRDLGHDALVASSEFAPLLEGGLHRLSLQVETLVPLLGHCAVEEPNRSDHLAKVRVVDRALLL